MTSKLDSKERVSELLPFYVNDTLDAEERAEVEALLSVDEALRREVELLNLIRGAVKEDEVDYTPGEFGLARLRREIDGRPAAPRRPRIGMVATSVAAAMFVFGSLIYLSMNDREPRFVQAGADASARVLVVAFRPSAQEQQISALLLGLDVTIIDGPSAIGLYRVAVPEAQDMGAIMAALSNMTDVVESVDATE
ncbi:hypothetical protein DEA8626_01705 [Defluviimonas aquaemixtae]|uniref:Zinc-finger domain-containing protein n=1 Tax=Albidovulum aquaemixtae TaxID=1542388 RepID=A0A2R8B6M5_9RHOB|nr:hypothetical protein [Defluviimonas aquaemixtae]SPH18173.1 hypothetical protein DEA8626_01705 [Defluviimonas aquaemixtae]